jgi:ribosomal protein L35
MFTAKNPSQKSRLRRTGILGKADAEKIKIMMPYA